MDYKHRKNLCKKTKSEHDLKEYFSDICQKKSNNLIEILTKSFKPIIETAHKKFVRDNYSTVVRKVETDRLSTMGKSDMDFIYEKYFKKSLTRSQTSKSLKMNSSKKKPIKRQGSFLIENNIIDKKDILKNPCNKKYIQICKSPDISIYNEFYEREKQLKINYDEKKNLRRSNLENKILNELKPIHVIAKGSQKIIEKNNLDKRPPLHLRFKELAEEKTYNNQSIQKDLKKNSLSKIFKSGNTLYGKLTFAENNNPNNNFNSNTSGLNFNAAPGIIRSKSYNGKDFGDWLETNKKWYKMKVSKTENLKIAYENLAKKEEEKNITFNPSIGEKSKNLAELIKKNDNEFTNIFDKLYVSNHKKKEYIQNLQQKYKPTFKPIINKYPQFLNNNTVNQTTKSFYLEEKEDEYEEMLSNIHLKDRKDNYNKIIPQNDKPRKKELFECNKVQKEVANNKFTMQNKKNLKKSKKEIDEFFYKMNKGTSPNYGLEINDIKFL